MTNPKNGEAIKNDQSRSDELIRRGELQRCVDLFCAFMIGAGYAAFVDRARQMVSEILSDIPAIPAAPDTPEVLALVEALHSMCVIAENDKWHCALTGRDLVLKGARAAIAAWEASRDR